MNMDKEMMRALEEDGEKLRQLTGKDHGPIFLQAADPACPECGGTGQRDSGWEYPWGEAIFLACDCAKDHPHD